VRESRPVSGFKGTVGAPRDWQKGKGGERMGGEERLCPPDL